MQKRRKMKPVKGWAVVDPHFALDFEHMFMTKERADHYRKDNLVFCKQATVRRVEIREVDPKP